MEELNKQLVDRVSVKLAPQRVKLVVQELNKVLDEYRVFGQTWNMQVIQELILENLTKNQTLKLIDNLNKLPISEWND